MNSAPITSRLSTIFYLWGSHLDIDEEALKSKDLTADVVMTTTEKAWFFDRVLEKYGESEWVFEPGYPYLDRIVLYEQRIDIITGKHSAGRSH